MTDFAAPIPIWRSTDARQARAFYVDYLHFTVLFEHRFAPGLPLYMSVKRGACEIHLSEHTGDTAPQGAARVAVPDVHALCTQLNSRQGAFARVTVQRQPFGFDDMDVIDPFGNRITFCTVYAASE